MSLLRMSNIPPTSRLAIALLGALYSLGSSGIGLSQASQSWKDESIRALPAAIPSNSSHISPSISTEQLAQGAPSLLRLQSQTADPADQAEPPGLLIQPSDQSINPFLSLAMLRELNSLVGRFESALFAAAATGQPVSVNPDIRSPLLTAGTTDIDIVSLPEATSHPALLEARRLIYDWPQLIEQKEYAAARDRWLAVRRTLWSSFPTENHFAQPEIRAMWLDRGTIVRAGSRQRLAEVFDRMAAAGINTVFFETVNAGYPIYPSRIAPEQNPLTRQWDPLEAAVELAHERNIELHAWIWTFAAGNQLHNQLLNQPADYPGPLISHNPIWAGYDNHGRLIPPGQTKPFLDPANPEVRRYLLQLVEEIVTRYDVDGLQLDYIRYPFQDPSADRTYGYGLAARQQFQRLSGVDPLTLSPRDDASATDAERTRQRNLWNRWTDFRIEQISSFVEEVSQLVRRQRSDIIVSTAVFAKPEHERLQKIQQDWGTWANEGTVDWVVLMSYALDTNRLEQLTQPWLLDNTFGSTLIIPGIRLLNLPEAAALDQIQALRDLPAGGYALFATANLEGDFEAALNRIQGPSEAAETPELLPQHAPFAAASVRYQALQQEWNLLLTSQQLWISEVRLSQWAAEVNLLGRALEDLAADPSPRKLAQVRSRLNQLEMSLYSDDIELNTTSNRYRLQTWSNRLAAIERLLDYGEQRLARR
ncbi:MAG: family 10 glycosylhydrolase [Leptolyngbyaceae cyanobacterium SM1_1_3]|nr:family 10 glycosylhydrolase [Leptolyngbyaceae cyanobacterium SM1_1_3]NJN02683.1 family 10 glycosylhydrolase [Leptolyngbyaceae cyanobacterium RM1_1_2]